MIYGYARELTGNTLSVLSLEQQKKALLSEGSIIIFEDSAKSDRHGWLELCDSIKPGDEIIVRFDCLATCISELEEIECLLDNGVLIRFINYGNALENNASGRLQLHLSLAVGQYIQDLMIEEGRLTA